MAFDYYFVGANDMPTCITNTITPKPAYNSPFCEKHDLNSSCPPICTKNNFIQRINVATTQGDWDEVKLLKSEMAVELLNMEGGYDIYINYLDSISSSDVDAAKILASTYLTEGKYNSLEDKLNIIQQSETEEGYSFVILMNTLKEAQLAGRDINELNGSEVLLINRFAQNDTTTASYIAEGLLYQIYGYEYDHNPNEIAMGNKIAQIEEPINDAIQLYPNPAKESFNVTSKDENIKELKIYNMLGALVYSSIINDKISTINIQGLPTGIYFAKLIMENSIISRKLTIE